MTARRSSGMIGLAALLIQISTLFATAAGGVSCASKDGKAEISINLTRQPIYTPTFASARLGDKHWVSTPQHGETELGPSQGMIEAGRLSADFADKDVSKIIISLRVDTSAEDDDGGVPGTLTFEDGVARKVFCEFE
ncbi:MAG: hypothetical protein GY947_23520 [Rhodobacteraceae bacterium]|nr:hypothetical protein [Paracoccaceae bacterium]